MCVVPSLALHIAEQLAKGAYEACYDKKRGRKARTGEASPTFWYIFSLNLWKASFSCLSLLQLTNSSYCLSQCAVVLQLPRTPLIWVLYSTLTTSQTSHTCHRRSRNFYRLQTLLRGVLSILPWHCTSSTSLSNCTSTSWSLPIHENANQILTTQVSDWLDLVQDRHIARYFFLLTRPTLPRQSFL